RQGHEPELELVAAGLGLLEGRMRRFAVCGRRDVAAAREHQPAESLERGFQVGGHVEHAHVAAHVQYRLAVVFDLATVRDADKWHSRPSRYIRAGTSMPIRPSARVSSSLTYATAAARQRFRSARSSFKIG